jgi:hypothetical protein
VIEAYAWGNDVHSMTEMKINQTWLASHAGPIKRSQLRHARLGGQSPMAGESLRVLHPQAGSMTTSGVDTEPRWPLPRGLIVVLSMTGLLVSVRRRSSLQASSHRSSSRSSSSSASTH